MSDEEEGEIDEIRQRRMLELRQRFAQEQQKVVQQQQLETAKQTILRRILDPEARQRLNNLKMVKPEYASQIELQLIQLAQSNKVKIPISDELLKEILMRLQSQRRDIKITRR